MSQFFWPPNIVTNAESASYATFAGSTGLATSASLAQTASYFDGSFLFVREAATPLQRDGLLYHDGTEEALGFFNNTSSSIFLGKTIFRLAENNTGVTIPKGTVVEYAGTSGASGRLFMKPAIAPPLISGSRTNVLGVLYNDTPAGNIGDVILIGPILNLNTSTFTAGDVLYLSATTSGALANTPPANPNFERVKLGYVTRANTNNGRITVRVQEDNRDTWADIVGKPVGIVSSSAPLVASASAGATYTSAEQALLNQMRQTLINAGLLRP